MTARLRLEVRRCGRCWRYCCCTGRGGLDRSADRRVVGGTGVRDGGRRRFRCMSRTSARRWATACWSPAGARGGSRPPPRSAIRRSAIDPPPPVSPGRPSTWPARLRTSRVSSWNGDRLTIRLLAPDPEILARMAQPIFCAVPSDTPIDPKGVRTLPSAGPYYITSYTPGKSVVLLRNPNYHGSRPHRVDRIELDMGIPYRRAVADVESGDCRLHHARRPGRSQPAWSQCRTCRPLRTLQPGGKTRKAAILRQPVVPH